MSIQPPDTEGQPIQWNGGREDSVGSDAGLAEPGDTLARTGTTKPGRKRAPDYRLRGLDLDAHGLADTPSRAVRRKHPSRRRRRRRLILQWFIVLAVIALVVVLLRATVFEPFTVSSTSMVPNLQANTDVLVVKPTFLTGTPDTGDIIVFREPAGFNCSSGGTNAHEIVERVIGLPGQTIASRNGSIYIDGKRLKEPGWYNPPFGELAANKIVRTTVPAGHYFVMGDNRTDTCDSRTFGPIAKSSIVGHVVASLSRDGHLSVHSL